MDEKEDEVIMAYVIHEVIHYIENKAKRSKCTKEEYVKLLVKKSIASGI